MWSMTEENDIDGLAAEYVLGLLSPAERAKPPDQRVAGCHDRGLAASARPPGRAGTRGKTAAESVLRGFQTNWGLVERFGVDAACAHGRKCAGFSDAEVLCSPHALTVGVGEAPRHEVAGGRAPRCGGLYGDFAPAGIVGVVDWASRIGRGLLLGRRSRTAGRAERASSPCLAVAMNHG